MLFSDVGVSVKWRFLVQNVFLCYQSNKTDGCFRNVDIVIDLFEFYFHFSKTISEKGVLPQGFPENPSLIEIFKQFRIFSAFICIFIYVDASRSNTQPLSLPLHDLIKGTKIETKRIHCIKEVREVSDLQNKQILHSNTKIWLELS